MTIPHRQPWPRKVLFLSLVAGLVIQYFYFLHLPEISANLFGSRGVAQGYLPKGSHVSISSISLIFNSFVFFFIGSLFKIIPARFISFPYKSYWFSSVKRDDTIARMTSWTDVFGCVVNVFLIVTFHLVYLANLKTPPQLNNFIFLFLLGLFFIFLLFWLILLYISFKPPTQ